MKYTISNKKYPISLKSTIRTKNSFFKWLHKNKNIAFNKTAYETQVYYTALTIQESAFLVELNKEINAWNTQSTSLNGYEILMDKEMPPLNKKSFKSFLDKVYRTSFVYNERFPAPPKGGWIDQNNFQSKINDLVRAKISCKFIDGPEQIAKKLKELADKHGLNSHYSSRNYDDGYYAYHFYVTFPIDTTSGLKHVEMEIQISTQLKEVMYEILHKFYANDRSKLTQKDWKWDIGSDKFRSGYLSHTLHLIEAMIVELRNK